jgi:hypothetical protein
MPDKGVTGVEKKIKLQEIQEKRKLSLKQVDKKDKKGLALYKNTEDQNDLYYYDGKVLYSVVDGDRKGPSVRMSLFDITGLNQEESLNEAKAVEKKTTKEVTDMETRGYDYKTLDNIDNVYGQEFLLGYLVEIGDVKNSDKSIDELKAIITKNLSKDRLHYVKKGQFGIKDLGYTDEHPGLGKPKEPKGKYKSSGYGDLESENFEPEKPKSNTKDLGEKENKTGMPRKIDLMSMVPKSSKGIKKMPMPGKEKKIKLQETEINHIQEQKLRNIITKLIVEAINQKEIDAAGEEASVKAKTKLIDKEINKRKKKLKALTTLKELEADSVNPKKIKELSDDIKKLEKLKDKLNKKPSKKAPQQEEPLNERSKEEIAAATAEIDAEIKNKETQKKAIDKSIQALKKAQGTTKSEQPTDAA